MGHYESARENRAGFSKANFIMRAEWRKCNFLLHGKIPWHPFRTFRRPSFQQTSQLIGVAVARKGKKQNIRFSLQLDLRTVYRLVTFLYPHPSQVISRAENINVIRQWYVSVSDDVDRVSASHVPCLLLDVEENKPQHFALVRTS